jgi:peptide/nickel transport system permease protein
MTGLAWLLGNRKAVAGLTLLLAFAALALVGPALVGDPTDFVARPFDPPSAAHWLGTTGRGQDVFWQTVAGARPTLAVGFLVGVVVVAVGAAIGAAAGYLGGWLDDLLSLLINIFLVIPGLPLMVVVAAYLTAGPGTIAAVLIFTGWAWTARVVRAQTQTLAARDFVAAAVVSGESRLRIVLVEILPNMAPLLLSSFAGAVLYAIGAQVGLEFLGLGDVERVSWGTILYWARNDAALITGSWWVFVPAGLCVGLVGCALALVGSACDELAFPRLRQSKAYRQVVGTRGGRPLATVVLPAGNPEAKP